MMKAIVFDFGNVLGFFDHDITLRKLAEHTDLSIDQMRELFYAAHLEEAFEAGQLSSETFLQELHRLGKLRCTPEFTAEAWGDIFSPNKPVCALVPRFKPKYKLLLGSNTNALHARKFVPQFADVLAHFNALVLSHEIGVRKPKRGFFEHCQRLAGCAAEECVFIDDLPSNVAGARELGWHGIVFTGVADLQRQLSALGVSVPGKT
jgi:putative hydrolase of the HAD superfamily